MQNSSFALLKKLDSPMRFLSFTMADFMMYLAPFFLGALFDSIAVIPATGLAIVYGLKKIGKKFPKFYLIRWLYWSLPSNVCKRVLRIDIPESHKRFWIY